MPNAMTIRNVRPMGKPVTDLHIVDGRFVTAGKMPGAGLTVLDGGGRLLFPGFVDAHAHIDKSRIGTGWHRNEVGPTIQEMIDNERRVRREEGIDPYVQSLRVAKLMIAAGTTHVRTFVDIDTEQGLAGLYGVMQTRDELREMVDIEIVAFPQSGMLIRPGTFELIEAALQEGAAVVGGLDPCAIDRDPVGHLDCVFALAEKYDRDIDIHLHEPGEMGAFSLELIAERTKTLGWQGRVVVSHAFCLGGVDHDRLQGLIELLVENDIVIMSHGPSGPRVPPPVKVLRQAGVRMCIGNDGIRDTWGPLNMPDMLLRTFLLVYRNNFRRDDDIEMALDIATYGGSEVVKATDYGLEIGDVASFVLVDGETHAEAVFERPPRWLVVKNGKVVAQKGVYAG